MLCLFNRIIIIKLIWHYVYVYDLHIMFVYKLCHGSSCAVPGTRVVAWVEEVHPTILCSH